MTDGTPIIVIEAIGRPIAHRVGLVKRPPRLFIPPDTKGYMTLVRHAAQDSLERVGNWEVHPDDGYDVAIDFYFPGKPIENRWGDLDKLTRGVLDALVGAGVMHDDANVIKLHCLKLRLPTWDTTWVKRRPQGCTMIFVRRHPEWSEE